MQVYDYHRPYIAVPRVGKAVRVGFMMGGELRTVVTGVIRRVTHDQIEITTGDGVTVFDKTSQIIANFPNIVVEEEKVAA